MFGYRIALSAFAAHALRITFVVVIAWCLLLILQAVFETEERSANVGLLLSVVVGSAVVTSVCFPGLFGRSERTLDRWILGDALEYRDRVQRFIDSIPSYGAAETLVQDLPEILVSA